MNAAAHAHVRADGGAMELAADDGDEDEDDLLDRAT